MISLVFLFLLQTDSLIESASEGDLSGVEDALLRGANVNATLSVSLLNLLYKRIWMKQLVWNYFEYEDCHHFWEYPG